LRPWWRASLFLIPILAGSLWGAGQAIRVARVTYEVDTLSIPELQKALQQDPGNPDLLHRLGWVYSYNPSDIDLPEAVKYLRQAADANPHRWDLWSDLGITCDFVGNTECSDEAFQRAKLLNSMTPALQWTLGNHYLLTNRQEMAYPYFRNLLDMDPDYLDATLRLCLRATKDPQAIYKGVIPKGKEATPRFAFLMILASESDYESAMRIWGQMVSGQDKSPQVPMVKPFLDFLVDHNQIQDAATVWGDLQHAAVIPPAPPPSINLLYNGSFDGPRLNTGFDWRTNDSPALIFDLSDASAYQGRKCLRIDFAVGQNADYALVDQVVRVKPNTQYQLTAYVRSDNLTSNSGPRLRVVEMGCGDCADRTSEPTLGSTPWHSIDVKFTTRPQTEAVRVSFWRPQDQPYPSDITGTVWLDDVILRAVDAAGPDVSRMRNP
jgi:tetratricopeptide (TPR) repeat protein